MKKLLLTGSHGFLASRFFAYYKDQYDFILLNRNTLDITDEKQVYRLFKEEPIDIVFHTAAIADTGACQNDPALAHQINVQSTVNIAKGCALQNSVLVFAGSDQIFSGNAQDGPYTEETVPMPGNVYAQTKYDAEKEIAAYLERYYLLRLTWMFSLPEKDKKTTGGILLNMIRALMSNTPLFLNENDYRGLTYVYEVIENFAKIIELPYGTYHTGSENDLSVYEIGAVILDALRLPHRKEDILCKASRDRRDLRMSNTKLKAHGIRFSQSEQAIRRCISEFMY